MQDCYLCNEETDIQCSECDKPICSDHSHNYIDICKSCFLKLNDIKDWIEQEVNN